jgi:multiple sugar transport system substrate-binding protein
MRSVLVAALLGVLTLGPGIGPGLSAPAQQVVFTSNQFTPIEEQEWVRNTLLAKFTQETGISVQFTTENEGPYVDRLLAETKAGKGTIDVTGTLHGIFPVFTASNALRDMTDIQKRLDARKDRTFFPDLLRVAKMDGIQAFIPWTQATYLIAARKESLKYFPVGRDPMRMT